MLQENPHMRAPELCLLRIQEPQDGFDGNLGSLGLVRSFGYQDPNMERGK